MRNSAPDCQSCDRTMEATTLGGEALIGWYCTACDRFRPQHGKVKFNDTPVSGARK